MWRNTRSLEFRYHTWREEISVEINKCNFMLRISLSIFVALKCLAVLSKIILFPPPKMFPSFYTYMAQCYHVCNFDLFLNIFRVTCFIFCLSGANNIHVQINNGLPQNSWVKGHPEKSEGSNWYNCLKGD